MEPKAHHIIIGLFTLLAFAAALLFALWLAKSSADRNWSFYQIGFNHPVSGLSKGNPVLYSGVQVGDVVDLHLDPRDPSHVRVLIRVDQDIPIRENTRAGLVLANITGSMSIQFTGGTLDSPILEGSMEDPPLIMARRSAFDNLMANGQDLLQQADALLTNANRMFSQQNTDNLSSILTTTREAVEALMAQRAEFSQLLTRLDTAGQRAAEASVKVAQVSDTVNTLLTNDGQAALASLEQTLTTIQATAARIDRLTRENEGAMDSGLQGMGELAPALRELRSTLRNLNQFTRRLGEDPTRTIWGGETIKELSQ
ncbi:MlaD family protein [Marinobacter qingdaonensis]|uniref:MlaD family protein n=1 Tax=Marinobacter qingdaonensis TaxID=3108486 RepID=A0ABU5P2Q2_9GAMM|nr:MlaD family protein [Marinobacter sp. ASW11-75]MEA1082187.1 MlaD family protein [Marinobacter sp. ASW11-75]